MNYQEYLRSARWQRQRKSAMGRANNACQICASTHALEVHHNTYAHIGDERPYELIVLCAECHSIYHSRMTTPSPTLWEPDQAMIDSKRLTDEKAARLKAQKRAANLAWLKSVYGKKQ